MATSPNYGWAEPDNSSLVKNGAQDIRALGDAIDTSVWNVGYGQAGKNKVINGDFTVNQRNFTSTTTSATYGHDRWNISIAGDGTVTYSNQTFTAGAAPVAGYEAKQYARVVTASQTTAASRSSFSQPIENVRTFAGQTATISFWAKAATGTPKIATELGQFFGSGGSPSAGVYTYAGQTTISTSWARYSVTVAVPSISGKTVGTTDNTSQLALQFFFSAGSNFDARTGSLGIQNNTIDIWGVQMEYGSKATPFQTATGTLQGELAACQRYYWRVVGGTTGSRLGYLVGTGGASALGNVPLPVIMRTAPTVLDYADLGFTVGNSTLYTISALTLSGATNAAQAQLTATLTGSATDFGFFRFSSTTGFFGVGAEL
jgi:hypothetical protein